jgi:hypothetical protein
MSQILSREEVERLAADTYIRLALAQSPFEVASAQNDLALCNTLLARIKAAEAATGGKTISPLQGVFAKT